MKVIVSHPSIAPHVKQTVMAYQEAAYLKHFYTSFFEHPENSLSNKLSAFSYLKNLIKRRQFNELPIHKFISRPLPELMRTFFSRLDYPLITDRIWEWSELSFDNWVAKALTHDQTDVVHTYEHCALNTLVKAKAMNILSVYEQPSQHHLFFTKVVQKQFELYPELRTENTDLLVNSKAVRRNKRRDEELKIADLIICNSSFTKKTLIEGGIDAAKIEVIPLAFPVDQPHIIQEKTSTGPVKFLYAGNQSIRKGSHLLYEAWKQCNFNEQEAELYLIGKMTLPEKIRRNLPGKVIIKENIPHQELMDLYNEVDVFVLPTLADGFGMVVTEAMANGIPVIATDACCGPDLISPTENGWIIPAGDLEALINQLKWCTANKIELPKFGAAALRKAQTWTWHQYREKLSEIIFNKWTERKTKPSA
ncbi:glycosyltransferase [Pedobacter psychrodurus]|uniref:Glycosyltransferase n=1 Tax=Pedobacter psychrodurus TaxID=2530456 RepID=A0A4R0Q1J0_9SPHI|nr:glycosyltransferase [Pedobacter psychrodurus]TCD28947.1 glycosyltransferase [Pedobacter psychrodurus]